MLLLPIAGREDILMFYTQNIRFLNFARRYLKDDNGELILNITSSFIVFLSFRNIAIIKAVNNRLNI